MSLKASFKTQLRELFPGYFALVMATAALSLGAHLLQLELISSALLWINTSVFIILLVLFLLRLALYFSNLKSDFFSEEKGPGFFTLVAGSCLLGLQYVQLKQSVIAAEVLLFFSVAGWLLLLYSFLLHAFFTDKKPSPGASLNGNWLLLVVATQAISILTTTLTPHLFVHPAQAYFFSLTTFYAGVFLYIVLIVLIIYRMLFFQLQPDDKLPPYWINMGAAAISTVAAVALAENLRTDPYFQDIFPFLKAMSLFLWAVAVFWIPVLVGMEVWQYGMKKTPMKYYPSQWSLLFPLCVFSIASFRLSALLQLYFLQPVARFFFFVAAAVWLALFLALCLRLFRLLNSEAAYSERRLR